MMFVYSVMNDEVRCRARATREGEVSAFGSMKALDGGCGCEALGRGSGEASWS